MNRETPLMQEIRLAIVETGRVQLWRNNTFELHGMLHQPGRKPFRVDVRAGIGKGGADLVGEVKPFGRFFGLEVKTDTGELEDDQRRWGAVVREGGGFYAHARNVDAALEALARAEQFEIVDGMFRWRHDR